MILGKVIGTVWSTRKDENLVGAKFLIVRHLNLDYTPKELTVVAVDSVGAGLRRPGLHHRRTGRDGGDGRSGQPVQGSSGVGGAVGGCW